MNTVWYVECSTSEGDYGWNALYASRESAMEAAHEDWVQSNDGDEAVTLDWGCWKDTDDQDVWSAQADEYTSYEVRQRAIHDELTDEILTLAAWLHTQVSVDDDWTMTMVAVDGVQTGETRQARIRRLCDLIGRLR